MFSEAVCDSLPPCTLNLIDTLLQSPFVSEEVFSELIDDLRILNRNCWRILTQARIQEASKEDKTTLESTFYPLLSVVCRECSKGGRKSREALQLLQVGCYEQ